MAPPSLVSGSSFVTAAPKGEKDGPRKSKIAAGLALTQKRVVGLSKYVKVVTISDGTEVTVELASESRLTLQWRGHPDLEMDECCTLYEYPQTHKAHQIPKYGAHARGLHEPTINLRKFSSRSTKSQFSSTKLYSVLRLRRTLGLTNAGSEGDEDRMSSSRKKGETPQTRFSQSKEEREEETERKHELLSEMILAIVKLDDGEAVGTVRDSTGASILHALLLANTPQSKDLALKLLAVRPSWLMHVHSLKGDVHGKGDGHADEHVADSVFEGEGLLHIAAVNREEGLAEQLCDLAVKQGGGDALMTMLWQQATGVFFTASSPQWRFGGSAISYLVVFDMELLLHRLLRDEKDELFKAVNDTRAMHDKQTLLDALSDDGAKGEYRDYKAHPKAEAAPRGYRTTDPNTEYLPLHAAVACGNTRMYDFLADLQRRDDLVARGYSPLTLSARLGLHKMFRHVLQRATRVDLWGPIKQHQVPLMEIDPAGIMTDSNVSVMALLARHDASKATQQMLLDSFLNGFLFKLFRDKWAKWARIYYLVNLAILVAFTLVLTIVAAPSVLFDHAPTIDRADEIESRNYGSNVYSSRGLTWALLVFAAVLLFEELREFILWFLAYRLQLKRRYETHGLPSVLWNSWRQQIQRMAPLRYVTSIFALTAASLVLREHDNGMGEMVAERSTVTVRVLLAFSSFFAWFLVLQEIAIPFEKFGIFTVLVFKMLRKDVTVWLLLFTPICLGFTTALTAVSTYPSWASRWGSWWLVFETLLLYALTGEPPQIVDGPHASEILGEDVGNRGIFRAFDDDSGRGAVTHLISFYFFYICFQLIVVLLLINLLIAMMSSTYGKTMEGATLEWRVNLARTIIRYEVLLFTRHWSSQVGEIDPERLSWYMPFQSYDPSVRAFPGTSDGSGGGGKKGAFGDFFGADEDPPGVVLGGRSKYGGLDAPFAEPTTPRATAAEQNAAITAKISELQEEVRRMRTETAFARRSSSVLDPSAFGPPSPVEAPPQIRVQYSTSGNATRSEEAQSRADAAAEGSGASPEGSRVARSNSLMSGRV